MFVIFLQILIGMEAHEDDDMEVDIYQDIVIIPVRDKGKDAKLLKAYSTSAGLMTIHQMTHIMTTCQNVTDILSVESV